eukprot:UC1_evm1s1797
MTVTIDAPFKNDPPAPSPLIAASGESCPGLWDYEVVECFILGEDETYLELEFCPHGQHLVLALRGPRGILKDQLPLVYKAKINDR